MKEAIIEFQNMGWFHMIYLIILSFRATVLMRMEIQERILKRKLKALDIHKIGSLSLVFERQLAEIQSKKSNHHFGSSAFNIFYLFCTVFIIVLLLTKL